MLYFGCNFWCMHTPTLTHKFVLHLCTNFSDNFKNSVLNVTKKKLILKIHKNYLHNL